MKTWRIASALLIAVAFTAGAAGAADHSVSLGARLHPR
jgi:Skp family chaperone for outer membrane proteins